MRRRCYPLRGRPSSLREERRVDPGEWAVGETIGHFSSYHSLQLGVEKTTIGLVSPYSIFQLQIPHGDTFLYAVGSLTPLLTAQSP